VIEAVDRFVRGAGEFADDQQVETATHAVVVRSPHAMRGSRQSPA
jgi:CO/xanthine dehydrogenase Mo-binding subunit